MSFSQTFSVFPGEPLTLRPSIVLEHLLSGGHLSQDQAGDVLRLLADEAVSEALKGSLLAALRAKGETPDEVRGLALAMREAAVQVTVPRDRALIDTCGTGGDGSDSINISTGTSLLVAAAGEAVVKHGNRSISSQSGSADVLDHLGLARAQTPQEAATGLETFGYTFLFAPAFHPAMKAILPVRRAMGVRTVFNMLGPLTNPAQPDIQLLGAFSEDAAELMAHALAGTSIKRAAVVHGHPGWDEATPSGPFVRFDVRPDRVSREVVDPTTRYGIPRCSPSDLSGGDAAHNAARLRAIFAGERGPQRDAIVLNAALVFELCDRVSDPLQAVALAEHTIDSGAVTLLLKRMQAGSRG